MQRKDREYINSIKNNYKIKFKNIEILSKKLQNKIMHKILKI